MRFPVISILLLHLILLLGACQSNTAVIPTDAPLNLAQENRATVTQVPTITPPRPLTATAPPKPNPTQTAPIRPAISSTATTTAPPDKELLAARIQEITAQAGGRWHIIIKEIGGEQLYLSQPERRINIASVVKVPLALLFFQALENSGIPENQLETYIQVNGTGGRTFDQLLRAMLVQSEEDATQILDAYIRDTINVPAQMAAWDLTFLDLVARRYTAEGIASVFERFYLGDFVSPTARKLLLAYLSEYTPNDELRVGALTREIPGDFQIYNKRGSLLTPYVVADCAILENPNGSDYLIILFAYQGEPKTTYEILEQAQTEIALAFWQTLSATETP